VRIGSRLRVVDILSAWAARDAQRKLGLGREIVDGLDGVEVALTRYNFLLSMIFAAAPVAGVRASISAEDLPQFVRFDQRWVTEFAEQQQQNTGRPGMYIRALAAAPEPVVGPLVCTCMVDGVGRLRPPLVLFDGGHRVSAWILHGQAGKAYPLAVNVILTGQPVPLLGKDHSFKAYSPARRKERRA